MGLLLASTVTILAAIIFKRSAGSPRPGKCRKKVLRKVPARNVVPRKVPKQVLQVPSPVLLLQKCGTRSAFFGTFLGNPFSGISKPMVWVRVAFHENDGNHENDENDEVNSDSYKQGVECWSRGNHGNHENDENHENPGCKPRV